MLRVQLTLETDLPFDLVSCESCRDCLLRGPVRVACAHVPCFLAAPERQSDPHLDLSLATIEDLPGPHRRQTRVLSGTACCPQGLVFLTARAALMSGMCFVFILKALSLCTDSQVEGLLHSRLTQGFPRRSLSPSCAPCPQCDSSRWLARPPMPWALPLDHDVPGACVLCLGLLSFLDL